MKKLGLASLFLAVSALVGCGGGGGGDSDTVSYTGESDPVAITQDNATPLAEASVEASYEAVQGYTAESESLYGVVVSESGDSEIKVKIKDISLMLLKNSQADQFPAGVVYTADDLNQQYEGYYYCGGSVSISDSLTEATSSSGSGTVTYNDLCVANFDGVNDAYINGSVSISWGETYETITYSNLSVTVNGEVIATLNGELSCAEDASTGIWECTTTYYYAGSDGKTYKVADVYVWGDDYNGWNVNATFYHPDYGFVTMVASGLKFECTNGRPSAGTIDIRSTVDDSSVFITFVDCDTATATYTSGGIATDLSLWQ